MAATSRRSFLSLTAGAVAGTAVREALMTSSVEAAQPPLVFVSSFAAGKAGAIQAYRVDPTSGALTPTHRTTGVENPFFLALTPDSRFLYSIHAREFGAKAAEEIQAFEVVGRDGQLKPLNRQSALGSAACYLHVDQTGGTLLVANYTSGSVASLPVRADGSIGEAASFVQHLGSSVNKDRQTSAHAHSILTSPNNRFVYSADLGLDQIVCYRLDPATARMTPNTQPFVRTIPGAGPRHITFHPNGKYFYAINELANSVTLFDYNSRTGILVERQTISTLPKEYGGVSHCADLKITPDGRFLYGTNRGHDSIACYAIAKDGSLSVIGIEPSLGKGPQNLLILPGGKLLLCANMPGNNVAVFKIDSRSGAISSAGSPTEITSPSCIRLLA